MPRIGAITLEITVRLDIYSCITIRSYAIESPGYFATALKIS